MVLALARVSIEAMNILPGGVSTERAGISGKVQVVGFETANNVFRGDASLRLVFRQALRVWKIMNAMGVKFVFMSA